MRRGAPLEVAVVGCGYMGTHHARTVASHPGCRLVATIDLVPDRAVALAAQYGGEARTTVPDGVEAVVVATPTSSHVEVAAPLLADGRWCLVEKPVAATLQGARHLAAPTLVCGHVERFNPAVRAAGRMRPRYVEARRMGPRTGRSGDVDVVLDLMIHDLDLVLAWAEGEVEWLDAVGVAVEGPRVDTASVRMRTSCGMTASLVASRVADRSERVLRVFEPGRYTALDMRSGVSTRLGGLLEPRDGRDALTAQLDAFVAAVRGEASGAVRHEEGFRALELAERIGAAVAGET